MTPSSIDGKRLDIALANSIYFPSTGAAVSLEQYMVAKTLLNRGEKCAPEVWCLRLDAM